MITNIYMVTSSYCKGDGVPLDDMIGLFWTLQDAKRCVDSERDRVLKELWGGVSVEEVRKNTKKYFIDEDDQGCLIRTRSYKGTWSMINISKHIVRDRKHIDVLFDYNGKTYCEPVYIDDIDLNHYENAWDWWFRPYVNGNSDNDLNFELIADLSPIGLWSMGNAYINVYENIHSDTPIATVRNIKFRKSWLKAKAFTKASSKVKTD